MVRPYLPLNGLRAFEASARHLSFTLAAEELCVTQAAVSHQVKQLEARLNVTLFKRLPRGLKMTAEGEALLPVLGDSFDRIAGLLRRFDGGHLRELLTLGVVGTLAVGWLLPRLPRFRAVHPFIDLRLFTNNNRVDLAAEGLDFALRFGNGAWHSIDAVPLFEAPLAPLCIPALAESLKTPADLFGFTLLRSYRTDEWQNWFAAAGHSGPMPPLSGITFDSSLTMIEAALQGVGVALAPPRLFARQLAVGELVQPFPITASLGSYYLTRLKSRPPTPAMRAFQNWLLTEAAADG